MGKEVFKQELWAQTIQNELDLLTGLLHIVIILTQVK